MDATEILRLHTGAYRIANEYPEEEEIPRLLQTAREDQAEQEKRQNLDKARNLLAARHYDECRPVLADLQKRFPTNEEISDLILELKADEEKQRKPLRFAEARDRARISPHVLVGFETNTNSITAGDLTTGTRGSIPNDFVYTAGADARITRWLTGDFDIVGQRVFGTETVSVTPQQFLANCGTCTTDATPPTVTLNSLQTHPNSSYNITNASMGIKARPFPKVSRLVFTANVLVRLDDGGLRSSASPLFGVGYTF